MDFLPWSLRVGLLLTFPPSDQEGQCSVCTLTLDVNHPCIPGLSGHQTLVQSRLMLVGALFRTLPPLSMCELGCAFLSLCFGINNHYSVVCHLFPSDLLLGNSLLNVVISRGSQTFKVVGSVGG